MLFRYLTYGPYGSYLPTYDHRLDDLSETQMKPKEKINEDKKELNRLYHVYGGDKEILYVQSLQVKDRYYVHQNGKFLF